jgi:hypothetical protein
MESEIIRFSDITYMCEQTLDILDVKGKFRQTTYATVI